MSMIVEVHIADPAPANPDRTLRFSKSPIRIGRNQLNDISLQDPFVSEWHGIIRFDDRGVAYFDLGSTNGTMLDGERLAKNVPAALSPASKLQLGLLKLTVSQQRDDNWALKTMGWSPQTLPPAAGAGIRGPMALPSTGAVSGERRLTRMGLAESDLQSPVQAIVVPSPTSAPSSLPTDPPLAVAAPGRPQAPGSSIETRYATILEAFSEAFVGLRKGYEQFGTEVGIRIVNGTTPLHRARTSREVLDYVLAPGVDPEVAARDLIGIFADFAIHHIAMMEGITEGARALLHSLDPRANQLDTGPRLLATGKTKLLWKSYLERFEQLVTEDEQLHAAIFGDEFAHAYASVTLGEDDPQARKDKH
jgi:type VI secretion system protein ImpI